MLVDAFATKASIAILAALGVGNVIGSGEPTVDTVVMVNTSDSYMCSQVISLREDEVPALSKDDLVPCSLVDQHHGVRILVL